MSGYQETTQCPNCGSEHCMVYTDYKPFQYSQFSCADCGWTCIPKQSFCDLEELNIRRDDEELKPLDKMPKTDYGHNFIIKEEE